MFCKYSLLLLFFLLYLFPGLSAKGQSRAHQIDFEKSIDQCLRLNDKLIQDSALIYAFNFQVVGKRDAKGRINIGEVKCNDSLAYTIFPDFEKLRKVDFSPLIKQSEFRIVIPVVVFFKNHDERATIRMDAALNAALALLSPVPYDNETEKYNDFGYQVHSQYKKLPNYTNLITNSVFVPIRFVQVHRNE